MRALLLVFILSFPFSNLWAVISCEGALTHLGIDHYEFIEGEDPKTVIYFFHGIEAAYFRWKEDPLKPLLEKSFQKAEKKMPSLVFFSLGSTWINLPDSNQNENALTRTKLREKIQKLEDELNISPIKRRIYGHSMGAFNALHLALKYPQDFSRLVLTGAPLSTFDPTRFSLESIKQRTKEIFKAESLSLGTKIKYAFLLSFFAPAQYREYFLGSPWEEVDLVQRIERMSSEEEIPDVLFIIGKDDHGFLEGNQRVFELIQEKSLPWSFDIQNNGHFRPFDNEMIADYLAGD